jgi:hypothetical protein
MRGSSSEVSSAEVTMRDLSPRVTLVGCFMPH